MVKPIIKFILLLGLMILLCIIICAFFGGLGWFIIAMGVGLAVNRYKKEQESQKGEDDMEFENIIIPKSKNESTTNNHYMSGEDLGYCNRANNIRTFNKWR